MKKEEDRQGAGTLANQEAAAPEASVSETRETPAMSFGARQLRSEKGPRSVRVVHAGDGRATLLMPREMVEALVVGLQGKDLSDPGSLPPGVSLDAEGNLAFSMGERSVTSMISWARIDDVCFP
ncbi:MAG: hypothetical protein AAGC60_09180 [Acidobacteriota bacterium]